MLDSIYLMTLELIEIHIFGVKTSRFLSSFKQRYNRRLNVTWLIDFIAWLYITHRLR